MPESNRQRTTRFELVASPFSDQRCNVGTASGASPVGTRNQQRQGGRESNPQPTGFEAYCSAIERPRQLTLEPRRGPRRTKRCKLKKTPVGIEPTSTGLQPVASPSGTSVAKGHPFEMMEESCSQRQVVFRTSWWLCEKFRGDLSLPCLVMLLCCLTLKWSGGVGVGFALGRQKGSFLSYRERPRRSQGGRTADQPLEVDRGGR